MSNIYDVFNLRKEGMSALQEGFNPEGVEEVVFENFEDPCEVMEEIITESANEFIELQGALYMNELVLESHMFDNFDETEMNTMLEASIKERADKIKETIKKQWAKLTAWFKQTIVNIQNFFTSGEELVKKYKNDIPKAIKNCKVTAKVNEYLPVGTAIGRCDKLIQNVKAAGSGSVSDVNEAKTAILKAAGATDRSNVAKVVRACFIHTEKPVEKAISSLDPNVVMDYAGNKKAILDSINKAKSNIDKEFNEILGMLSKTEGEGAKNAVSTFQFAISVKNTIINAEIACVKKGCSDNKAIISKALGGKKPSSTASAGAGATSEKMDKKDADKLKMKLVNNQLARQTMKESLEFEDITFGDEY